MQDQCQWCENYQNHLFCHPIWIEQDIPSCKVAVDHSWFVVVQISQPPGYVLQNGNLGIQGEVCIGRVEEIVMKICLQLFHYKRWWFGVGQVTNTVILDNVRVTDTTQDVQFSKELLVRLVRAPGYLHSEPPCSICCSFNFHLLNTAICSSPKVYTSWLCFFDKWLQLRVILPPLGCKLSQLKWPYETIFGTMKVPCISISTRLQQMFDQDIGCPNHK